MRMAGKINLTTIYGFYIKNWKTSLLKALYNGRIDISHILKTQEIIPINLTKHYCTKCYNGILSDDTYGYVRGRSWGRGLEEWEHYFLLTKFCKIFFMFKIFYMVPLGSYVKFSPNLSKFSEWMGVTFLTNLPEIFSSFFKGGCKICQPRNQKTLKN